MQQLQIASRLTGILLLSAAMFAQSAAPQAPTGDGSAPPAGKIATIRGCLRGDRGNYLLIEQQTGSVFVLKGVGNKLNQRLNQQVEVSGRMLTGSVKTGIRPEKQGSNPADTVHGVDGVPFQVADVETDVRTIAKKCKAADAE